MAALSASLLAFVLCMQIAFADTVQLRCTQSNGVITRLLVDVPKSRVKVNDRDWTSAQVQQTKVFWDIFSGTADQGKVKVGLRWTLTRDTLRLRIHGLGSYKDPLSGKTVVHVVPGDDYSGTCTKTKNQI